MRIKCPRYSHKFSPAEDEIYLDYSIGYDHDKGFVWEKLPILKSLWINDTNDNDIFSKDDSAKI